MTRLYELEAGELRAVVALYQLSNPYMTPARIYARWRAGKINLLKDYKIWPKNEFMKICKERNDG